MKATFLRILAGTLLIVAGMVTAQGMDFEVETTPVIGGVSQVAEVMTNEPLSFDGTFEDVDTFTDSFLQENLKAAPDTWFSELSVATDPTDSTNHALKINFTDKYGAMGPKLSLEAETDYQISFEIWADADASPSGLSATVSLRPANSIGTTIDWTVPSSVIQPASDNASKIKVQKTYKAGVLAEYIGTTDVCFVIQANAPGTIWLDNLSVVPVVTEDDGNPISFDGTFEDVDTFTDSFLTENLKAAPDTWFSELSVGTDPTDSTNHALKIDFSKQYGAMGPKLSLKPGNNYQISFDIWADADASPNGLAATVSLRPANSVSTIIDWTVPSSVIQPASDTASKTKVQKTYRAEAFAEYIETTEVCFIIQANAPGTVWIDNLSVVPFADDGKVLTFDGSFETVDTFTDAFLQDHLKAAPDTWFSELSVGTDPTDSTNHALKIDFSQEYGAMGPKLFLKEGCDYTVSFDIWADADASPDGLSATVSLRPANSIGTTIDWTVPSSVIQSASDTASKTRVQKTYPASTFVDYLDTTEICLVIQSNEAGTVWLDNLSIVPVQEQFKFSKNQIRTGDYAGLRFAFLIDCNVASNATDYGFVVTRSALLGQNELTLDLAEVDTRIGFAKIDSGSEIVYEAETNTELGVVAGVNKAITVVLTGIPQGYESEDFVVRPFFVLDGFIYYGNAVTQNYAAVANA